MPASILSHHAVSPAERTGFAVPRPIDSLTSLRGFLALWVVFYHFWKDILALFPSVGALTPLARQGHIAVPVFFMLSGFVLAYNYSREMSVPGIRSYIRFLLMRLARIYPVHLFTLLVVLGMVVVCRARGWPLMDAGYGAGDFVLNLFLAQTWIPNFQLSWNYPSWSISSEWFAYLCFPFFCATILRRITTRVRAYTFLALCGGATIVLYVLGNEVPFHGLLQVIPTFLAGMAIFACQHQVRHSQHYHSPFTTHHISDFLLVSLAAVPLLTSGPLMMALLLAGFVVLVYRLAIQRSECSQFWTNRYAVYLGEISYSLYMAHTLAQKVCYKLLPADQFSDATLVFRSGVLLVYATGIAVFVLGTYYLVERPSRRALRRLFRNGDETHRHPPVSSLAA